MEAFRSFFLGKKYQREEQTVGPKSNGEKMKQEGRIEDFDTLFSNKMSGLSSMSSGERYCISTSRRCCVYIRTPVHAMTQSWLFGLVDRPDVFRGASKVRKKHSARRAGTSLLLMLLWRKSLRLIATDVAVALRGVLLCRACKTCGPSYRSLTRLVWVCIATFTRISCICWR